MKKWLIGVLIVVAFLLFVGSCNNTKNNAPKNPFTEPGVADAIMTELKEKEELKGHNLEVSSLTIRFSKDENGKSDTYIYCKLKRETEDKSLLALYVTGEWHGPLGQKPNKSEKIFYSLNSIDFKKLPDMIKTLKKKADIKDDIKSYEVFYSSLHAPDKMLALVYVKTSHKSYEGRFDIYGNLLEYK